MAKILVVEDMDSVVELLRTLLHREGSKSPLLTMVRRLWKLFVVKSPISCCSTSSFPSSTDWKSFVESGGIPSRPVSRHRPKPKG